MNFTIFYGDYKGIVKFTVETTKILVLTNSSFFTQIVQNFRDRLVLLTLCKTTTRYKN